MGRTHGNNSSTKTGMSATFGIDDLTKLVALHRVGPHSVWGLLEHCPVVVLNANDVLLKTGQSNQTMYFLLAGELGIHLDGTEGEPLAIVKTGEAVGELSVIDDRPASATVVARSECRLLAVDETTFWRLVESSHEFATNMLLRLAQRLRGTDSSIAESVRMRRQSEHEARVDGLTGLHNRRWLDETLPRVINRHQRDERPCCLLMVDIDHFKDFNDNFGHQAGDRVLTVVGRLFSTHVRPTDLLARYGGEEFTVILPDTDRAGARVAAERLRDAVRRTQTKTTDGAELPAITVSIGIGQVGSKKDASEVIEEADKALYKAKENGRNRVEW
jgi:diguanylate cyclase (GGDEF)-like protein